MGQKGPGGRPPKIAGVKGKLAVEMRVAGRSAGEIGERLGVTPDAVRKYFSRKEIKARIQAVNDRLLEAAPDIVEQTLRDIRTSNTLSQFVAGEIDDNPTRLTETRDILSFMKLSGDKQSEVLRSFGVLGSQSQSVTIQNILKANSVSIINPSVLNVLKQVGASLGEGAVNGEVVESKELDAGGGEETRCP